MNMSIDRSLVFYSILFTFGIIYLLVTILLTERTKEFLFSRHRNVCAQFHLTPGKWPNSSSYKGNPIHPCTTIKYTLVLQLRSYHYRDTTLGKRYTNRI